MRVHLFLLLCCAIVSPVLCDDGSELQVETLLQPSECKRQARRGDMLSMHYRGSLLDGTEFDSRYVVCLSLFLLLPP